MRVKKIIALVAVAALACCLLCATGCSKKSNVVKSGELHVALNPGYAGFEELTADGKYVGVDVDLAQKLADDMGLKLVIENMEFDSVIPSVKAGTKADLGISGITITDERSKEITFSDPYYSDDQSISVSDTTKWTKANYKEGLNKEGITIYTQTGTTGATYAKENFPKASVVEIADISAMFSSLAAGNCDAVVQNAAPTASLIKQSFPNLSVIDTVATGETYGIAVNKNNTELLSEVNKLIAKYKEDGSLKALLEKYGV